MARSEPPRILVADDDEQFLNILEYRLREIGFETARAQTPEEVLRELDRRPALLMLDVYLGEYDGIEVLGHVLNRSPDLNVIMMTARGSIESSVLAMRSGAIDYLTKPINMRRLMETIQRALGPIGGPETFANGVSANPLSLVEPEDTVSKGVSLALERLVLGESTAMQSVRAAIARLSTLDVPLMILGESGVGKELVARALHELSPRRGGPFVNVNLAMLPSGLVEPLFGLPQSSTNPTLTDSKLPRIRGYGEMAHRGILFLDELGEIPQRVEMTLLRFFRERLPVGLGQPRPDGIDVRVIASTHRTPEELIRTGRISEELRERLGDVSVVIPPLRERREDIPILVTHCLEQIAARLNRAVKRVAPRAMEMMGSLDWPGNVRQLAHFVERLAVLQKTEEISHEAVRHADQVESMERQALLMTLRDAGGSLRQVARAMGVGRAALFRKIKRHGILTILQLQQAQRAGAEDESGSEIVRLADLTRAKALSASTGANTAQGP